MRKPEEYDLVILGGGTGSTIAAWTFAEQGQRVAVIDRKYIGGSCPEHRLPAEQEHHSGARKVASYIRRSEEFGNNERRVHDWDGSGSWAQAEDGNGA